MRWLRVQSIDQTLNARRFNKRQTCVFFFSFYNKVFCFFPINTDQLWQITPTPILSKIDEKKFCLSSNNKNRKLRWEKRRSITINFVDPEQSPHWALHEVAPFFLRDHLPYFVSSYRYRKESRACCLKFKKCDARVRLSSTLALDKHRIFARHETFTPKICGKQ